MQFSNPSRKPLPDVSTRFTKTGEVPTSSASEVRTPQPTSPGDSRTPPPPEASMASSSYSDRDIIIGSTVGASIFLVIAVLLIAVVCYHLRDKPKRLPKSQRGSPHDVLPKPLSQLCNDNRKFGQISSFHEHSGAEIHRDVLTKPWETRYASFEMLQRPPLGHRPRLNAGTPEELQASAEHMYTYYNDIILTEERGFKGSHVETNRVSTARRSDLLQSDDRSGGERNSSYVPRRMLSSSLEETRKKIRDNNGVVEASPSFRQGRVVNDQDIAVNPRLEPGVVFIYTGQYRV